MHVHVANQRSHLVKVLFNRRLLERCDHERARHIGDEPPVGDA